MIQISLPDRPIANPPESRDFTLSMSAPRTLSFFGGAATATGSMILLEAAGARLLLDAGLFEGDLAEVGVKNRDLPLDPSKVDSVLLSQAGLGYAGRVPQLVGHGFAGPVYSTPGTRDLAAILLAEAALELESSGNEPLFTLDEVISTQRRFVSHPFQRTFHLRRNLACEFFEAGHMLGSASVALRTGEGGSHRIIYSGCIGRPGSPLWRDPAPIAGPVDTLIVGSAMAHEGLPSFATARAQLAALLRRAIAQNGQVIVPAFNLGPVHEFIRVTQGLAHQGEIPPLPIYLDTTAPISLPTLFRLHPECVVTGTAAYHQADGPFDNSLIHQIRTTEERESLSQLQSPAIIVTPSDSAGGGLAATHLKRCLPESRHTVIFLSFQEEGSLGRLLQEGVDQVVIGGETVQRRASIEQMPAYGGVADGEEMRAWLRALGGPIKRAFVVHGDDLSAAFMATILREEGVLDVIVPRQGESFPF